MDSISKGSQKLGTSCSADAVNPFPEEKCVGARLKALRKKKGWTQAELAEWLGLDRGYLSEVERGERNVTLATLEVIAKGFGLSVSRLLSGLSRPL